MNIIFLFVVDFLIAIGSFHGSLRLCSTAYTSQTNKKDGGHGGRVVTLWPPTSEAGSRSVPGMASSGKAGSCLPLVGSLQYRTLMNCMYWFPLPFQLPVVI